MFQQQILAWYDTHKRCLPWRNISDPYKIWVSEIVLQQTRIAQGHDYYLRFVSRFPTVESLAAADEDEVMAVWQGLGYYSRARNMQQAARQIVNDWGGTFPDTYEGVRSLKGVGDYTAAAICSFAYGIPRAVVDGNVYRVLARHFGVEVPIDTTAGKKYFAQLAQELLPSQRSADYNQALMDFGATQCTPASPDCDGCCLNASCEARQKGTVGALPIKSHKTKVTDRCLVYVRTETPQGVWLRKRTGNDIWKGLYEYPLFEFEQLPSTDEFLQSEQTQRLFPAGGTWRLVRKKAKHVLSHRNLWIDFYQLTYANQPDTPEGYTLIPYEAEDACALPQILQRLKEEARKHRH